jgi:tetratricopeptide (TPR) repeat protein
MELKLASEFVKQQKKRQSNTQAGRRALLSPMAGDGGRANAAGGVEFFPALLCRHQWVFGLFLMAATMIAYLPMWHAGFLWDDDVLLTANPLIKSPHGWYQFWFTTKTPDYFPIMSSAFWLEWRLWEMNPTGYHVVNVLLHALNAILLWQLLARLKIPGAMLAAAIFALHPVNAATVAWIAELKNTLSLFFFVLALLGYLQFDDTRRWRWYALSFGAFLFALLSKIEVAPLPFVLLGIAWWRRGRVEGKDLRHSVPFFAAAFGLGLVSIWYQTHVAIGQDVVRTDNVWARLAGAGWAVWFYLGKTLWPVNLIPIYPRWQIDPAQLLSYVPGLLLAAGFLFLWPYRRSWGKAVLFGLGYAVLMFLPVLGFVNIYFFRFSLVANHWQYFSIIGPVALAAAGITSAMGFLGKGNSWLKPAFCGTLLLTLGALTWQQSRMYADDERLWRTTIEQNPGCWAAHNNLGAILIEKMRLDEAMAQFQQTLAIKPDYPEASNNLGKALLLKGQTDEAIAQFQRTLAIRPDNAEAHDNLDVTRLLAIQSDDAVAYYNLGIALLQKGLVDEAILHYQRAVEIQPDFVEAHYNLGNALLQKGLTDEAILHYQTAIGINPDYFDAHNNLGTAFFGKGKVAEAIAQYQAAIKIQPGNAETHNNLAYALLQNGEVEASIAQSREALKIRPDYAIARKNLGAALYQKGQVDEAIIQFQRALAIQPNLVEAQSDLAHIAWVLATSPDPSVRDGTKAVELAGQTDRLSSGRNPGMAATLAAAYAEAGRFPEAITTAQRALQLATSQNNATLAAALEAELKLYQAGFPFHDLNPSR